MKRNHFFNIFNSKKNLNLSYLNNIEKNIENIRF